jgi:hypothetical protein
MRPRCYTDRKASGEEGEGWGEEEADEQEEEAEESFSVGEILRHSDMQSGYAPTISKVKQSHYRP